MPQASDQPTADNATIQGQVGQTHIIDLAENPTTGHVWQVDHIDDQLLELTASEFVRQSDRMGAGGTRRLRILLKAPGAGQLQLKHGRPSAGDKGIGKRQSYTFQITADAVAAA